MEPSWLISWLAVNSALRRSRRSVGARVNGQILPIRAPTTPEVATARPVRLGDPDSWHYVTVSWVCIPAV